MALDIGGRRGQEPRPTRDSDDLISGGPPSSGGARRQRREPLGVPEDYTATVARSWTPSPGRSGRVDLTAGRYMAEQGPRYFVGDEWKPAQRGPESIAELQRALVMAGYLSATDSFRLGAWDGPTRTAYKQLLEDANGAGVTDEQMIYRRAQSIPIGGGGEGGPGTYIDPETGELVTAQFQAPPLQLQVPNFDDVRRVLRSSIVEKLGVGWSQQQIDDLARDYTAKYKQVQVDAYNQQVARERQLFETGTSDIDVLTQVEAPSPEAFAEEVARHRDPGGFQATQLAEDYAPAFFAALGSRV